MDAPRSRAVKRCFKDLFEAGLIYRGDYLVNWDPVAQTALADDEVEFEEREGSLWHIRYPMEDGKNFAIVATTRPETLLGDTAIAVSPQDERYKGWIGKKAIVPFVERKIPIIADHRVEATFGTGMVKVTPAHDFTDHERGRDHHLPSINIMTPDGRVNEEGKEFAGLSFEEARHAIVQKLREKGLLVKVEPHKLRIGVSYRSKAVIEPYLSKQWFVRCTQLKKSVREAVESGRVNLIPEHWRATYFHWIDHLRDWCISRQLWWGHRIPIWYRKDDPETLLCYDGEGEPPEVVKEPDAWVQDRDVLDTWFSSALWPMSILGWPDKTPDFKKFYPNSVLVTGHDILFFWVARMIMMGQYETHKAPFDTVFLHGLIYGKSYWRMHPHGGIDYVKGKEREAYDLGTPTPTDVHSKWEKMSKSKGNVIDPIEIIDSYGTDALRIALCSSATHARQIDLDRRRFEEYKNFTNKVWNGARFVFMNLEGLTGELFAQGIDRSLLTLEDRWILSRLGRIVQGVEENLTQFAFDRAATSAYDFFWKEFCAYYVELAKPTLFGKSGTAAHKVNKQKILAITLLTALRLLHPMTPYITEELFQHLKKHFGSMHAKTAADVYTKEALLALAAPACIRAPFPKVVCPEDIQETTEALFELLDRVVTSVRNIRAEMQLPPSVAIDLFIVGAKNDPDLHLVEENIPFIRALVRIETIHCGQEEKSLPFSATHVVNNLKLIVPLPGEMREKEWARLIKERDKLIAEQSRCSLQLANKDFINKAPPALVEKLKTQLDQVERQLTEVAQKIDLIK